MKNSRTIIRNRRKRIEVFIGCLTQGRTAMESRQGLVKELPRMAAYPPSPMLDIHDQHDDVSPVRMKWPVLILASASPRRAELLQQLGAEFKIISSDVPELHHEELTAVEVC